MADAPPPPPPSTIPKIQYTVREPWSWVMERVSQNDNKKMADLTSNLQSVPSVQDLALVEQLKQHIQDTPRRRGSMNKKTPISQVSTLRLECLDESGTVMEPGAFYGTSSAFDGLEDKDELVRTLQRCRCEHLGMSPPSVLIKWDVTREECKKMITELPVLDEANKHHIIAVLKEPMGSQGEGIYFVKDLEEMYEVVERHRRKALDEGPDFLDSVMERKGRIPSWVLQAEVYPPRLIKQCKFHIRSYVAGVEKLDHEDLLDVYLFRRHEVRIAAVPVDANEDPANRDRAAHITNGAAKQETERVMLTDCEELLDYHQGLQVFCAKCFSSVWGDLVRRVNFTSQNVPYPAIQKFALAGLDIMMTADNRFYLLEVNVNPGAPPEHTIPSSFQTHLEGVMIELMHLVMNKPAPNFENVMDILEHYG